jgi:hypothetical protein
MDFSEDLKTDTTLPEMPTEQIRYSRHVTLREYKNNLSEKCDMSSS